MSRCRDVLKHKRIEDRVSGGLIDGMVFWVGLNAYHPENWLWGRLKGYLGQRSVLKGPAK
jgi:hypothetical protein